jgi:hypothetical protein
MRPSDWFTLVLRTLGVWSVLHATDNFVTAYNITTRLYRTELTTPEAFLTHGVLELFIGVLLLFTAPRISRFFYGPAPFGTSDSPSA